MCRRREHHAPRERRDSRCGPSRRRAQRRSPPSQGAAESPANVVGHGPRRRARRRSPPGQGTAESPANVGGHGRALRVTKGSGRSGVKGKTSPLPGARQDWARQGIRAARLRGPCNQGL
eukprot:8926555-Alexandrium_andersonii.AAC.1